MAKTIGARLLDVKLKIDHADNAMERGAEREKG